MPIRNVIIQLLLLQYICKENVTTEVPNVITDITKQKNKSKFVYPPQYHFLLMGVYIYYWVLSFTEHENDNSKMGKI